MSLIDRTNQGRRIRLLHTTDRYTQLRRGDEGTVTGEYDGTIMIKWDSGSNLSLLEGEDHYEWVQ